MNSGQTMLTLGSMTLLSILVMNVLRMALGYEDTYDQSRTRLEALALTSSLIEEACQLPFDEVSWDSTNLSKNLNDFTMPGSLGKDIGETSFAAFDDFDDFNNYTSAETTQQCIYTLKCAVCYVNDNTPNTVSTSRTYYKRLTVTAINTVNQDSVYLEYIHGYWYFN